MILSYSYSDDFKEVFKKFQNHGHAKELFDLDGISSDYLDINAFSKRFFSKKGVATADISVDSNSNVDSVDVLQYNTEITKPLLRLNSYFLLYKYTKQLYLDDVAEKVIRAQFLKEVYINDFHTFGIVPYCFNYSCMDIVMAGLPFVNRIKSNPPKHLSSFMGQLVQFVIYASNSSSGAVGLADLLICASWFIEKMIVEEENDPYEEMRTWKQAKQELQSFVYAVNQPSRGGQQSPFTNVSVFDDVFLAKLVDEYIFPDGTKVSISTVKKLQEIFVDLMNEVLRESPATFPITTACFAVDENKKILDETFLDFVTEKNMEFGFMNIYAGQTSTLSSCCRLRSDSKNEYFNAFGSGGTKIGSVGVVTVNLPRIAYSVKTKEDFLTKLKEQTETAAQINHVKRYILKKRIDNGHAPLYRLGIMVLNKQYSTTGILGINEALEILGMNILTEEGQQFVISILKAIGEVNIKQQRKYNTPHNVEQVPGENSAVKLAQADKILGYNRGDYALYSNQFVPLTTPVDILDRIKLQGMFDKFLTGGAICHLNFSERITDKEFYRNLLKKSIEMGVIYQGVNYNIQRCEKGDITVGKNDICPICSAKIVDNFTRVVGFLINLHNWHKTRREYDYPNRQWYGKNDK